MFMAPSNSHPKNSFYMQDHIGMQEHKSLSSSSMQETLPHSFYFPRIGR